MAIFKTRARPNWALEPAENPYDPECDTRHAGKVFRFSQSFLIDHNIKPSDGTSPSEIGEGRYMLCLYDLEDGTSLWIGLQRKGEYEIAHENKRQYGTLERHNNRRGAWMDPNTISCYRKANIRDGKIRDATIWRLGSPGNPIKFAQSEKRAITLCELRKVRARMFVDCRFNDCKTRKPVPLHLAVDFSGDLNPDRANDTQAWACRPCYGASLVKLGWQRQVDAIQRKLDALKRKKGGQT